MIHVYHWKHGWIPLTHAAALSKAHGSASGAEKYVHGAAEHHASRPTRGLSARTIHGGLEAHRSPILGRDLSGMSDESLAGLLGQAQHDAEIDHVVKELDRRDRIVRARDAAVAHREKRNAERDRQYEQRLAAGDDPETAYADVYGVGVERQRRNTVIASLRSNGFKGAGFDELTRNAFRQHVDESIRHAEDATNGHFFAGKTRAVETRDVRRLFTGPEAYARANASDELLAYWHAHGGRVTLADFRASMLGGRLGIKGQTAWA